MIDLVRVGNKIAYMRKEHHMTQDDLAEQLYVTRQLVSKWENGTGTPSIDVLLDLSRLFKVSFEELLCLDEEVEYDKEDIFRGHDRLFVIRQIIEGKLSVNITDIFYRLSDEERMLLLKAIRENRLMVDMLELRPKLTPREITYLEVRS